VRHIVTRTAAPLLTAHRAYEPSARSLRVQRRVSCRGALVVAGQRIHVGVVRAGQTLTVEAADSTWRVYDYNGLVAEVARSTTKPVVRFKVHKPEPPRRGRPATASSEPPPGRTTPEALSSPLRVT
jgi:hypothetical protein